MSNLFYTASADKTVGAWDARAGVLVHSLHGQHSRSITCLTVSQQGDKIAYAGSDGNVHVTDVRKWGILSKWNVRSHVYALEMDASGTTIACGLEFSLKL
jgi:WD40 repeat protein